MQTLLTKVLITTVTVAGLGVVTASQAQALDGFNLSGIMSAVSLTPPDNSVPPVPPPIVTAVFSGTPTFSNLGGNFASVTDAVIPDLVFSLETEGLPDFYSLPSFDITFTGAGGGITTLTVFASSNYGRTGETNCSTISNYLKLGLQARDNNGLDYVGDVAVNEGFLSMFNISFTAVPEPLTILGASTAVAFGAAFKRRKANKG